MTKAKIQDEIARLQPRAQAERYIALADTKRANPFLGAGKRLTQLEKQLAELEEREAAQAFLGHLQRYEAALRDEADPRAREELREIERTLAGIDRALVLRWQGLAHNADLSGYARQLETTLAHDAKAEISVGPQFPFTAQEVRTVALYRRCEARRQELGKLLDNRRNTLRWLITQYPALADVMVAGTERACA